MDMDLFLISSPAICTDSSIAETESDLSTNPFYGLTSLPLVGLTSDYIVVYPPPESESLALGEGTITFYVFTGGGVTPFFLISSFAVFGPSSEISPLGMLLGAY